jgi:CobQ-like glutamine amidotransferase family enzyme
MALSEVAGRTLKVCALYPDLMNIYADRGNLLVLERRCAWRGIGFELIASGLGEPLDGDAHDLFYIGGGQDRDQRLCAEDLLRTKRASLHGPPRARRSSSACAGATSCSGMRTRSASRRSRA